MDTGLYRDIVYTEYMLEHDLTYTEMLERVHVDETVSYTHLTLPTKRIV